MCLLEFLLGNHFYRTVHNCCRGLKVLRIYFFFFLKFIFKVEMRSGPLGGIWVLWRLKVPGGRGCPFGWRSGSPSLTGHGSRSLWIQVKDVSHSINSSVIVLLWWTSAIIWHDVKIDSRHLNIIGWEPSRFYFTGMKYPQKTETFSRTDYWINTATHPPQTDKLTHPGELLKFLRPRKATK